jgi:large subunit ribosomal protein L15
MKFNELTITSNRKTTRVGRGISAGKGKTAGRGTKGQGSRKSGGVRPGFEGGQMPLYMRIPKLRGFKSKRTPATAVYTGQLNELSGTIDTDALTKAGLAASPFVRVKIISRGEITKKLTVKLQGASKSAVEAITKAGGTFEEVPQVKRPASAKKAK